MYILAGSRIIFPIVQLARTVLSQIDDYCTLVYTHFLEVSFYMVLGYIWADPSLLCNLTVKGENQLGGFHLLRKGARVDARRKGGGGRHGHGRMEARRTPGRKGLGISKIVL